MKTLAAKNARRADLKRDANVKSSERLSVVSPPSSSPGASTIKGGGRANLTKDATDDILDLLSWFRLTSKRRDEFPTAAWNPEELDVDSFFASESDAACETRRKKFMKRLVKEHDAKAVIDKVYGRKAVPPPVVKASAAADSIFLPPTPPPSAAAAAAGGKVRLTLSECSISPSPSPPFFTVKCKGSQKKAVVFPRSSTVESLSSTLKSKLNLKKAPTNLFLLSSPDGVPTLVLDGHPSGSSPLHAALDDHFLCATSDALPPPPSAPFLSHKGSSSKSSLSSAASSTTENDDEGTTPEEEDRDPLAKCKAAYKSRLRPLRPSPPSDSSTSSSSTSSSNNNNSGNSSTSTSTSVSPNCEGLRRDDDVAGPPAAEPPMILAELTPRYRNDFPIASFRSEIHASLREHQVLIIRGATGSGKSTQVPQFILNDLLPAHPSSSSSSSSSSSTLPLPNILVTEPRRVAATTLAERVALEQGSSPPGEAGSTVGYQVRLDSRTSPETRVTFVTVGVLLRLLSSSSGGADGDDASLLALGSGRTTPITHIVIDEVHERDLPTDLALSLLRPVLAIRPSLKLVLMSATVNVELLRQYFTTPGSSSTSVAVLDIPGRTFPVAVNYMNECEALVGQARAAARAEAPRSGDAEPEPEREKSAEGLTLSPRVRDRIDEAFICKLCVKLADGSFNNRTANGAILIFLPGQNEIESLMSRMKSFPGGLLSDPSRVLILPLYSTLGHSQQRQVFKVPADGITKIILSTNIAETSVTIPDVVHVIDTGRVKESRFNSFSRIKELVTVWCSVSNAKQRAGRAGRVRKGFCWRLYSEEFLDSEMLEETIPEVLRSPLEETILQIMLTEENGDRGFVAIQDWMTRFISPPSRSAVANAVAQLEQIGALTSANDQKLFRLTPLGFHLAHLPMDAKVGKMLLTGSLLGCLRPALIVAGVLSSPMSICTGFLPGPDGRARAKEEVEKLIDAGFGGRSSGQHIKGDLVAAVACYEAWESVEGSYKTKLDWARDHGLDHFALCEVRGLVRSFADILKDGGMGQREGSKNDLSNAHFLSCCFVAGLYPNIAVLVRPENGRKGGRLLTPDNELTQPHPSSFQFGRVKEASSSGKDAYTTFLSKGRSVGVGGREPLTYLHRVDFVGRFAILLFGGRLSVEGSHIIVDRFLKFNIGSGGESSSILINELRTLCDDMMLALISSSGQAERVVERAFNMNFAAVLSRLMASD